MSETIEQWLPARLEGADSAGLPKYVRLRNALAEAINEGRLPAGEKLPPEDALTQVAGLSLGTVQKALGSLVDDGLVVRRQGMGTFVTGAEKPTNAPFRHCRFMNEGSKEPLPIHSRVVKRSLAAKPGAWSAHLRGTRIVCIERIFSINDEFHVYTYLYLDGARFPSVEKMPEEAFNRVNFKDLLTREYHHAPARFGEHLAVRNFPAAVCKAIGVAPRTSGGVLEIVAYDRRGEALYFQDLWIPPNDKRVLVGG